MSRSQSPNPSPAPSERRASPESPFARLAFLAAEAASRADAGPGEAETAFEEAKARAARFIAHRPRTEHEVRTKLASGHLDARIVERTVARLTELGLIDDLDYSRRFIEERMRTRGRSLDLLVKELLGKGVSRPVAEAAAAEAGVDESARVVEVAASLVRKVIRLPTPEQALRLKAMLLRRGFDHDLAETGVRAVMPPEGWD